MYYGVGEEVIYSPKNISAKVLRRNSNGDYLIEFDDKNLIPPQMEVPEATLRSPPISFDEFKGYPVWIPDLYSDIKAKYDKETQCPRCGTPWKETVIGFRPFYDCLKCNLKKEDA